MATYSIKQIELPNGDLCVLDPGTHYGTCTTAAGTAAKTTSISTVTELKTGLTIHVRFSNSNTVANPTLNVSSLGAKAIKRYGTTAPSTSTASSWNAGSVLTLTYDGTYWMLNDWVNTTYSAMTSAEATAGTATTARLITPARLKEGVEAHAPVQSVNGSTGDVTVQPTLVSGTNIKTINNESILGSGDLTVTANIPVETITVSAGTNISINASVTSIKRYGNVVSGYIRFTASSQISAYAYVINGLPALATSAVFTLLNEYNGQYTSPTLYADAGNTGLRVGAANMAAGTYNVSFTYICQ